MLARTEEQPEPDSPVSGTRHTDKIAQPPKVLIDGDEDAGRALTLSFPSLVDSLRALPGNGFYARDSAHAVLFVDSADTDNRGSGSEGI